YGLTLLGMCFVIVHRGGRTPPDSVMYQLVLQIYNNLTPLSSLSGIFFAGGGGKVTKLQSYTVTGGVPV
ncbi:MAG: hypothetical protein IJ477_03230, partial [Alistipes sp.]|nr:hypothetical protein [Alistipes sp.]